MPTVVKYNGCAGVCGRSFNTRRCCSGCTRVVALVSADGRSIHDAGAAVALVRRLAVVHRQYATFHRVVRKWSYHSVALLGISVHLHFAVSPCNMFAESLYAMLRCCDVGSVRRCENYRVPKVLHLLHFVVVLPCRACRLIFFQYATLVRSLRWCGLKTDRCFPLPLVCTILIFFHP